METLTDAYDPGLMRCRCADEHYVSAPQRSNAVCGFCSATYDRRNGDIHAPFPHSAKGKCDFASTLCPFVVSPGGGEQRYSSGLLISNGRKQAELVSSNGLRSSF